MKYSTEGPVVITRSVVLLAQRRQEFGLTRRIRDSKCAGLDLVATGERLVWRLRFRLRGKDPRTGERWTAQSLTLGSADALSPDEARAEAVKIKQHILLGRDPAAERRAAYIAVSEARSRTARRMFEAYAAALPARPKLRGNAGAPSARHVRSELTQARAGLETMRVMDRPVDQITVADLRGLLSRDATRPATRVARFGAVARFLDWLLDQGVIPLNPATAIPRGRRPRAAPSRDHVISLADLARLWHAAEPLSPGLRDLGRFLIAIPCRRGEAAAMEWQHLDLEGAEWHQPAASTKNRQPHRLHLHKIALDLLLRRHAEAGRPATGLVFFGRGAAKFQSFSKLKDQLAEGAGLHGWRLHDFRRSFASALGEAGASESVVDAILNHSASATRAGVLGVYQRSSRRPEQALVMQQWGRMLQAAIDGRPQDQAEIVPLTHDRRR